MISIIIPTLNEERFLAKTLSALTEGLRDTPYEIIVSDADSKDGTVRIAQEFGARIVLEPDTAKGGIARGRNLGAQAARGEYLVFLDADVLIPSPDAFFRKALSLFERNEGLVGLTTSLKVFPDEETTADAICFGLVNGIHALLNNVLHTGSACGEFQMIRSSAFRAVGGYDERLVAGEDNEMFMRLAKQGKTQMASKLVAYHSGRRAHIVGWPRLLCEWGANGFCVLFFHRSFSKQWKPLRTAEDAEPISPHPPRPCPCGRAGCRCRDCPSRAS